MNEILPKFAGKKIECAFSINKPLAAIDRHACARTNRSNGEIGSYTYYAIWLNDIMFTEYKIESGHIHVHHSIIWVYVCVRVLPAGDNVTFKHYFILVLCYFVYDVRAMTLTPISTPKIGLIQEIQSVQQYYSSITFKCEQTRMVLF